MPRRVEDILPNGYRSIRGIPAQSGDDKLKKVNHAENGKGIVIRRIPATASSALGDKFRPRGTSHSRFGISRKAIIVIGAIMALIVIGYFVPAYFSRAVFIIVPKKVSVNVDSTYVATNIPKEGLLTYKIISSESFSSTTVPAIDGPSLSAKAQGVLNIFNSYSETARRLVAGTRFSSPSGKIYRLTSSIMIPGYKISSTGAVIPGSIKSLVAADQVGTEYNIDNTGSNKTFMIVAYKGGDKYEKIYGELTNNIKGGASGNKKIIDPVLLASTTAILKTKLTGELEAMIQNKISSEYFMFGKGSTTFETAVSDSASNQAIVTVHGMIYGISIRRSELVAKLAGQSTVDSFGGFPFEPVGLDKITFTLSNQKYFSPDAGTTAVMQLKGNFALIGKVPVDELKKKFAGMAPSDTIRILRAYSPIIDLTKSSGQVVPPWLKIPTNIDKISIIIQ